MAWLAPAPNTVRFPHAFDAPVANATNLCVSIGIDAGSGPGPGSSNQIVPVLPLPNSHRAYASLHVNCASHLPMPVVSCTHRLRARAQNVPQTDGKSYILHRKPAPQGVCGDSCSRPGRDVGCTLRVLWRRPRICRCSARTFHFFDPTLTPVEVFSKKGKFLGKAKELVNWCVLPLLSVLNASNAPHCPSCND
jgi:hypothetical protein